MPAVPTLVAIVYLSQHVYGGSEVNKWVDYIFDPHHDIITYDLYHGTQIPALGIHTKQDSDHLYESLVFALRLGYRYIHTSLADGNYQHIIKAISTVGIRRSSIFLSLSIQPQFYGYESTLNAIKSFVKQTESFRNINLCLMDGAHVILDDNIASEDKVYESAKVRRLTWMALEMLKEDGICQNLGVRHYEKKHIKELMQFSKWKPTVNMIEFHPYNMQNKLQKYMTQQGMIVISENVLNLTAEYHNALLTEELFCDLADKYSKTKSQIILKWAMQQGIVALFWDHRKQHIADNGQIFEFQLDYNDVYKINQLNQEKTYSYDLEDIPTIRWTKRLNQRFRAFFDGLHAKLQEKRHKEYTAFKKKQRIKSEL